MQLNLVWLLWLNKEDPNMIPSQKHLFDIPEDVSYLNTAYMSPLMNSVVNAIDEGARLKAQPWNLKISHFFDDVDKVRVLFARIVNASAKSVAIIPSASYGLTTAAMNLPLAEGQKIVVLKYQFPSHVYPWKKRARESGAIFQEVDVKDGFSATQSVLDAIDERTAIAALPNVLWTNGALIDLFEIRQRCDDVGAALVLDLTQSAGAMVTDFAKIRPDFAVVANYKWMLGPYSTGFLYVAEHHLDGRPLEEGWIARKGGRNFAKLTDNSEEFESGAGRYDMGERANFALMPGVICALEQLLSWDVDSIQTTLGMHNKDLCERLDGIGLKTTRHGLRGPHFIGARIPDGTRADLLEVLAARKIFLSQRNHALRITPHLWNDQTDFDRLIWALSETL
jgi:selenocysteine lyase/cysteine desulfurase